MDYKVYRGDLREEMLKMKVDDGRILISVEELMKRRIELNDDSTGLRCFYLDNDFYTRDIAVSDSSGKIKIVKGCRDLESLICSERNFFNHLGWGLDKGEYDSMEGEYFSKGELNIRNGVRGNPIWQYLVDKDVLKNYLDFVLSEKNLDGVSFNGEDYYLHPMTISLDIINSIRGRGMGILSVRNVKPNIRGADPHIFLGRGDSEVTLVGVKDGKT